MWDFSRYNVIVQQVEGCSDLLTEAAERIAPMVKLDRDGVAPLLLDHLRAAAAMLDRRALRMLALYDPAARAMWRAGVRKDPRRGPAGDAAAAALMKAGAEAFAIMKRDRENAPRIPPPAKRPKNPKGFKRSKRLKAGR